MPFSGAVSRKNEGYPETMTISVSPDSMISEEMENRLGVYQRTNSTRNGRPEWEQVANLKIGSTIVCVNFLVVKMMLVLVLMFFFV